MGINGIWYTFGWSVLRQKWNENIDVILLYLCVPCDQYLAPEVLRKQAYDNTVDWWCLGSVLYEMLFGLVSFNFGPTVFTDYFCSFIR